MLIQSLTALCLALILCATSSTASAEITESYKCKLKSGSSRDEIRSIGRDYLTVQHNVQFKDFELTILFPKYGADISNGTFHWNGVSPDIEKLEAAVAIWESKENAAVLERWIQTVDDCESATLFESVRVLKN
jgi:hypothetical protein